MILREEALIERARAVLGIQPNAGENEIKYAYYRRMFKHHPDRNPADPNAHEIASLIGEAYQVLMGRNGNPVLLNRNSLLEGIGPKPTTNFSGREPEQGAGGSIRMETGIVSKSLDGALLNAEEIARLFRVPLFSKESAMILSAAREKSERASNGLAEVHAQVGLNVAPCPNNWRSGKYWKGPPSSTQRLDGSIFPVSSYRLKARYGIVMLQTGTWQ